jgi:hypothetical protein
VRTRRRAARFPDGDGAIGRLTDREREIALLAARAAPSPAR